MALLIDGYNLIHAANLVGAGLGPGGLERTRQALLDFLVASLPPDVLARTTVVFDATDAPRGLPRQYEYQGLTIRFASAYDDADALIEELIVADWAPRRLTVVSSDHRLHRAARRRRATAIDSDRWYAQVLRERAARRQAPRTPADEEPDKPVGPISPAEVAHWLREMGTEPPQTRDKPKRNPSQRGPIKQDDDEMFNPFPPGYAEDVEENAGEVDTATDPASCRLCRKYPCGTRRLPSGWP